MAPCTLCSTEHWYPSVDMVLRTTIPSDQDMLRWTLHADILWTSGSDPQEVSGDSTLTGMVVYGVCSDTWYSMVPVRSL